MSRKFLLFTLIVFSVFMNSCTSIYTEEPVITQDVAIEIDPSLEYFTEGNIVSKSAQSDGFVYKNSWIYVENQKYQKYGYGYFRNGNTGIRLCSVYYSV